MLTLDVTISGRELLLALGGASLAILLLIALLRRYFHTRTGRIISLHEGSNSASERNKYQIVNVFRLRGTFLQLGLVVSLGLALLGFAWTEYDANTNYQMSIDDGFIDMMIVPPPTVPPTPPPPVTPPPVVQEVPDEEVLDEEEPEFVDMSITDESAVVAPPAVVSEEPPMPLPKPVEKDESPGEIFKFVEEMPLFPGCSDLTTKEERKKCSDKELMSFLAKNIKYPAVARENGIEGTAFISFVVEKNGSITDAKILRAPGGGLGEEALRVVKLMNEQGLVWTPGKQRLNPVRVQFNLPVKFKLQ